MKNFLIFIAFLKLLYHNRQMILLMALRDLKAQYVGSVFGLMWAVINPTAQVAIFGIIFGIVFKAKPDPAYGIDSYFVYLICGLIPWQFFAQNIAQSTGVISSNITLVKKAVNFPSEILQIVKLISNLVNHLIGVGLLLIVVFIVTHKFTFYFPVIFVYTFCIMVFSTGIGWILSSLNVYLKDIQQMVGVVLLAWMYFTPIFYSPNLIPEALQPLWQANPMYYMVLGYRNVLLGGFMLSWTDLSIFAGISFFTFGIGGVIFSRLKPGFAEEL